MKLWVIAIGKVKEAHFRTAVDDYIQRIRRYMPIQEIEIRDESMSQLTAAIQRSVPKRAHLVALTIEGTSYSSESWALWFQKRIEQSKDVVFLIGGADGLPIDIINESQECLSLSGMTLPHRLARIVLLEQTYRAMTILRKEPYHH